MARFEPYPHRARLWSLDKVKTQEDFLEWDARIRRLLPDGADVAYALQHKFDGLTINLTYEDGRLVQAATRGNGLVGEGILSQVRTIKSVPLSVEYKGIFEVQGEGFMPISAFERYNQEAQESSDNVGTKNIITSVIHAGKNLTQRMKKNNINAKVSVTY